MSQIGTNFEIHEFINSGWPKWCSRGPPPKRPFLKTYVILPARDACKFCRFFLLGATDGMQKGLRVDFFAVVPGRAEKGSPRIFRKSSNTCFAYVI